MTFRKSGAVAGAGASSYALAGCGNSLILTAEFAEHVEN
jgi:hypothetical protein